MYVSWRLTLVMIAVTPLLALGLAALMVTIVNIEKNKQKWMAGSMSVCAGKRGYGA